MEYLNEIIMSFIVAIVTGIAGILVKHFYNKAQEEAKRKIEEEKQKNEKQRKEYERLLKEEQTRNNRQMILDEIEPLIEELNRVKDNIKKDETEFGIRIQNLKDYHNNDKNSFDNKIKELISDYDNKFIRIRESYKFRFIQLCKSYLKDGFITTSEWEQLSVMYDLYHGLGGNGQAEDYYEQVKKLEIAPDKE